MEETLDTSNLIDVINTLNNVDAIRKYIEVDNKHRFNVIGTSTQIRENAGYHCNITYKHGCKSYSKKWNVEARGFSAVYDGRLWKIVKMGLQSSFNINPFFYGKGKRQKTCDSDQSLIDKLLDTQTPVDINITSKIDGQLIVINVYFGSLCNELYSNICELSQEYSSRYRLSKLIATGSVLKHNCLIVISSNNTWIHTEDMSYSIITALGFEFDSEYKERDLSSLNCIEYFKQYVLDSFMDRVLLFCNNNNIQGNHCHIYGEIQCKDNAPAWGNKLANLAVGCNRSGFTVFGYNDSRRFIGHFEYSFIASKFKQPAFWNNKKNIDIMDMLSCIENVIDGNLSETDFFNLHAPSNVCKDEYIFCPEGFIIYIEGRCFRMKSKQYFWFHCPTKGDNVVSISKSLAAEKDFYDYYFHNSKMILSFIDNFNNFYKRKLTVESVMLEYNINPKDTNKAIYIYKNILDQDRLLTILFKYSSIRQRLP